MHDFNKSVALNKGSDEIMLPDFNPTFLDVKKKNLNKQVIVNVMVCPECGC